MTCTNYPWHHGMAHEHCLLVVEQKLTPKIEHFPEVSSGLSEKLINVLDAETFGSYHTEMSRFLHFWGFLILSNNLWPKRGPLL